MSLTKENGGLDFRDIESFNQALLVKQAWRLFQEPECFFAQVMRSIYYQEDSFIDASLGSRPYYGWRSVLHCKDLFMQGLSKKVGNGSSFLVWIDPWIFDNG